MLTTLEAALYWFDLGAWLLPVQPDTKYLVRGYGIHQNKIKSQSEALRWFGRGRGKPAYNLAVIMPDNLLCLDFDDDTLFYSWQDSIPSSLAYTYHETSRRGWHVFYRLEMPAAELPAFVEGVENKRLCTVAPSRVDGFQYQAIDYPVMDIRNSDISNLLSSLLSEKETVSIPGPVQTGRSQSTAGIAKNDVTAVDLVTQIKRSYNLVDLASPLTQLLPSGAGRRWLRGKCPFHEDKKPSFWLDTERGLWGCHACGIKGDVINFYARINGLTTQEAIREMAGSLAGVRG